MITLVRFEARCLKNFNSVLLPVSTFGQFSIGRNTSQFGKNALLIFNEDLIEGITRSVDLKDCHPIQKWFDGWYCRISTLVERLGGIWGVFLKCSTSLSANLVVIMVPITLRPWVTAYFLLASISCSSRLFSMSMGYIKVVCCSFIVAPDRNAWRLPCDAWKPVRGALPLSHDITVEFDHNISFVLVLFFFWTKN